MNILAFLLLSLLLGARSEPVTFSPPDGETLRNMVLSDSGLVLGSSHALRRLIPDLQVQQSTVLPAGQPNRLLAGDPGGTYSGSVMACHRTDCELLDVGDLSRQRWQASNVLLDGSYNAYGLFVIGPSGSSVFTAALRNEGFTKSRILRGDLVNVDQVSGQQFGSPAVQDEASIFQSRRFLAVFNHGGFAYLVNRLGNSGGDQIRVIRLCNNDTFTQDGGSVYFASYFEIQLTCSAPQQTDISPPTAATFIPSPNPFEADVLLVSATRDAGQPGSDVCAYSISTINQLMADKLQSCLLGTGSVGLQRDSPRSCPSGLTPAQREVSDNATATYTLV